MYHEDSAINTPSQLALKIRVGILQHHENNHDERNRISVEPNTSEAHGSATRLNIPPGPQYVEDESPDKLADLSRRPSKRIHHKPHKMWKQKKSPETSPLPENTSQTRLYATTKHRGSRYQTPIHRSPEPSLSTQKNLACVMLKRFLRAFVDDAGIHGVGSAWFV